MSKLLLVPLEDTVVFPGMNVTLAVDVGDDERVLLVPRHETEYAYVGTVAEVVERVRLPGGVGAVSLAGLHRGIVGAAETDANGRLRVEVEERPDETPPRSEDARARARVPRRRRGDPRAARRRRARLARSSARSREPGALADTAGYSPDLTFDAEGASCSRPSTSSSGSSSPLRLQRERLAELQVRQRIREDVESGAQKQQRDYFLRKQMDSIRKELGEDEGSVVDEYREKIARPTCPTTSASRRSASSRGSSGWATRAASRR